MKKTLLMIAMAFIGSSTAGASAADRSPRLVATCGQYRLHQVVNSYFVAGIETPQFDYVLENQFGRFFSLAITYETHVGTSTLLGQVNTANDASGRPIDEQKVRISGSTGKTVLELRDLETDDISKSIPCEKNK